MMIADADNRRVYFALFLILELAVLLRIFWLGNQSYWYDEVYTVEVAARELPKVLLQYRQTPPFHYILLHFWLFLGLGDVTVRLLSVIIGVAAVFVVFQIGKNLFDMKYGLFCAFLLALSPLHIWYSQEVRMYILVALLGAASAYYFLKFIKEGGGLKYTLGWVITTGLAIYTHYHAVFLVVFQITFFVIYWKRYHHLVRNFCLGLLAIGIMSIYIFSVIISPDRFSHLSYMGLGSNPFKILSIPYTFFAFSLGFTYGPSLDELHTISTLADCRPYLMALTSGFLVFATLLIMGLKSLWRDREKFTFVLLYLMIPVLCASLLSIVKQDVSYNVRYVIAALPAFTLVLARGLQLPRRNFLRWGLVAAFLLPTSLSLHNHFFVEKYYKEDYRKAADFIYEYNRSGDVILSSNVRPFNYYYNNSFPVHPMYWIPENYQEKIEAKIEGKRRVWLIQSRKWESDPKGKIKKYMESTYDLIAENRFPNIKLALFDLSRENQYSALDNN